MSDITIVSYNVLSSALSKPSYHHNSDPEIMDNVVRLGNLMKKLEKEIASNAIITLQEVSERWSNELTVFFLGKGYFTSVRNYGNDFNGYMGVLIAFPMKLYALEQVLARRISDTAYWPSDSRHEKFNNRDYSNKTMKTLGGAERRANCVIMNQLTDISKKRSFLVATYHMPCMFQDQKFMDIHAGLLVRFVQEAAKGMPVILTGDFNSKESSSAYEMITTGKKGSLVESMFHNHKDPDRISFGEDIRAAKSKGGGKGKAKGKAKHAVITAEDLKRSSGVGKFTTIKPMRSAYKVFLKREAGVTNFSNKSKKKNGGFANCIDYIFISEEFEVTDVLESYESKKKIKSMTFPDENELSDHVMIRAKLKLG